MPAHAEVTPDIERQTEPKLGSSDEVCLVGAEAIVFLRGTAFFDREGTNGDPTSATTCPPGSRKNRKP